MANYVDANFKFLGFPMGFQRDLGFALDRSEVFDSYEDAVKYATGTLVDADKDKRKLSPTSYVGQKISIVTNDSVSVYVIDTDRSLRRLDVQAVEIDGIVVVKNASGELTLKGSESALTGQVFGKKEDGSFGFLDQTGGGGGPQDAAIVAIEVTAAEWIGETAPYSYTVTYSHHQLSRSDLLVAVYDKATNLEIDKDINWTINENGDIIFSSQEKKAIKVLIAGGAATAIDSEARQQLISGVTLNGNTLTLNRLSGNLTCDLSSLSPNITSTGNTLTITKPTGSINIELANADQYLKKTDIGSTAGKLVALDSTAKIPSSYIGDLFITDVFTVAVKADLITLSTAKKGDIALVQVTTGETNDIYILKEEPYSTIDNWVRMIIPCDVLSVNGKTGVVVIGIDDIAGLRAELNKIGATLTANKIVITDANGKIVSSATDATELAKLANIPVNFNVSDYEVVSNRTSTIASDTSTDSKYATVAAIKAYVDGRIKGHTHNGTDSPKIAFGNLTGTENIATTTNVIDAVATHNSSPTAHETLFNSKQNKILMVENYSVVAATWSTEKTGDYYTYVIGNNSISEKTKVDIVPSIEASETILNAGVMPTILSEAGQVTLYAKNKPTSDINVSIYLTEIS